MNIAWKITRKLLYFVALVIYAVFETNTNKKPICGAGEAYDRQENDTITPDEFYNAVNRH